MLSRGSRVLWVLIVSPAFGGCFNHITGSPPTPPWYRLTKEGREQDERRTHPSPMTPRDSWSAARVEALRRSNECSHLAATHPHAEDRMQMFAACDAERAAGLRAADEEFARTDPEGWRAEVARSPTLVRNPKGP